MSRLKYIAAGKDGTVWVAPDGFEIAFHRKGRSGEWMPNEAGARADVIAVVRDGDVWTVNQFHQIHHFQNNKWTRVLQPGETLDPHNVDKKGDALTIAAAVGGAVWYVRKSDHQVFYRDGSMWRESSMAYAKSIAVLGKDNVWAVNLQGHITRFTRQGHDVNLSWATLRTLEGEKRARMIAAGEGGVWYLEEPGADGNGKLFRRITDDKWEEDTWAKGTAIAVGGVNMVWHLNQDGNPYWCTSTHPYKWERVASPIAPTANGNWQYEVKGTDNLGLNSVVMREYSVDQVTDIDAWKAKIKTLNPHLNAAYEINVGEKLLMPAKA